MRALPLIALAIAAPSTAQAQAPASLQTRVAQLPAILRGEVGYDAYFTPAFVQAVPAARFRAIATQLESALGKPLRIASSAPAAARGATVVIGYERGTATIAIEVEATAPFRVSGLRVTGTAIDGDAVASLDAAFQALSGSSGYGIYRLDSAIPQAIHTWRGDVAAPLGSSFKLWILAELARQIAAGDRRWADVVPLTTASLPSGITQAWPAGTPMTLQSLATLMISISDNTATDTLLATLGRDKVGRIATDTGAPAATLPVLSTREMFSIKSDPAWIARWGTGNAAVRSAMLADPAFRGADLSRTIFGEAPIATDTVEWFASPQAIAAVLARLVTADPTTRAVLATNPGLGKTDAARFAYAGYKGGSEPGVLTMNYLVRTHDGHWLAVTGNWHNPGGAAPADAFQPLMTRALALAGKQ